MAWGVLIFYRWPPSTSWDHAPVEVQNAIQVLPHSTVDFRIDLGVAGNRTNRRDTPEDYTACTAVNLPDVPPTVQERFAEAGLDSGPLTCREDGNGKPCSAVAWVRGPPMITTHGNAFVSMPDLVRAGAEPFLAALGSMVSVMRPWLASSSAKNNDGT